jgi:hypothetical protein
MYSFLNDKELYGSMSSEPTSVPNGAPRMQQAGAVSVQTQQAPRERPAEVRPVPPPQPPQLPEIFFKSLAVLEQRLMSLEERVVVTLEKLSSEAQKPRAETNNLNFWTFLMAVALSTVLVLFLSNFLRPRAPPPPAQSSVPFMIQSLPPQTQLAQLSGPPTPLIFSAPTSFLPRT